MAHHPLRQLAGLFLRLGLTAFGGPAAHIAMMRDEVVERRCWLTDSEFLDLLGATNLIPGPNSTEMAIHLGYRHGRLPGLLLAGTCFILPATLIVGGMAWVYVRFGDMPQVGWVMYGVGPIIIAIVLQALWKLGTTAIKGPLTLFLGILSTVLSLAGWNELGLLALGGIVMTGTKLKRPSLAVGILTTVGASTAALAQTAAMAIPFTLTRLTFFFLKVGTILFGSGYVLLAFLRADLVERWNWLTDEQLIDAVTVGQVTPGPVFTTATFIGYLLDGWNGATLATVGIFLPGFLFVACSQPLIPRLRASPVTSAVLDGVIVTSLGLMAAVTWNLGRSTLVDMPTVGLAIITTITLFTLRPNSTWLVLAGAAAGWLWHAGA